jgi:hypothetical protein
MPTRRNPYAGFNDPAIGQAFANLGALFAPPSAQDLNAYASAAATRQKASQLAEAFAYAKDPNWNSSMADRLGVATGLYSPNQSFYSVDQGNAVTRRGQDITAGSARYNADRDFEASRLNNADQQTTTRRGQDLTASTALRTSAMDNQRSAITSLFGSLKPGEIAPGVPAEIAGLIGLPAIDQRTGAAPILNDEQVKGAILRGLPEAEQRAVATQGVKTATVINPETNKPEEVFSVDAVGRQPYVKPQSESVQNYQTPDGKRGTAIYDESRGGLIDTQTKEIVPAGSSTFRTSVQGSAAETGVKTTEAQDTKALAANSMAPAAERLFTAFDTGKLPSRGDYVGFQAGRVLPSIASPAVVKTMTPEGQLFYQDLQTILPQQLLVQSGQGVTDAEYERTLARLVPVPGEAPSVTMAKRDQIRQFYNGVRALAGPAMDKIDKANASPAANSRVDGAFSGTQGLPSPKSKEEYDRLPSGAEFIAPNGSTRRKP